MSDRSELTDTTPTWDFNAPQYVDFNRISAGFDDDSHESVEEYFNYDHESGSKVIFDVNEEQIIPIDTQDTSSAVNALENKQNVDLLCNLPEFSGPTNGQETGNQSALLVDHGLESPVLKSEAADVIASPSDCRSRFRTVLTVNSARKRLSMSVDRGKAKMRHFQRNQSTEKLNERKRMPSEKRYVDEVTSVIKHVRSHSRQLVFDGTAEEDIINAVISNVKEEVEEEKKSVPKAVPHPGISYKCSQNIKLTEVKPFSFEKRDQQLMAKREEFIRKVLEDEKKARQFKAQPFPDLIYSQKLPKPTSMFASTSTLNSIGSKASSTNPFHMQMHMRTMGKQQHNSANKQLSNDKENMKNFKARPAAVLQKNPFKPLKAHHHTTDHMAFSLSTQQRAEKRAEWEQYVKLKEQQKEDEKLQAEKRRMMEEMEETKKMRALTIHRANPVPNFKASSDANRTCISTEAVSGKNKDCELNKAAVPKKGCTPKNISKPRPKSMAPLG